MKTKFYVSHLSKALPLAVLGAAILFTNSAFSASGTWTNADVNNSSWTNSLNWNPTTGYPGTVTASDVATFTGDPGTLGNPVLDAPISLQGVTFASGGWEVGGSSLLTATATNAVIRSNVGINRITGPVSTNRQVQVALNSTLRLSGELTITGGRLDLRQVSNNNSGVLVLDGSSAVGTQRGITLFDTTKLLVLGDYVITGSAGNNDDYFITSSGAVMGGTGSLSFTNTTNSARVRVNSGGILAPGLTDGSFGSEFGTFDINTGGNPIEMGSESILSINLGAVSGQNSSLNITSNSLVAGGYLDLTVGDVVLNLFGDATMPLGAFNIATFTNPGTVAYGTFGTVNYNGLALDTNIAALTYTGNAIVLNVIPEPTTFAYMFGLIALGISGISRRHRRPR
jgi:hypothetical protein